MKAYSMDLRQRVLADCDRGMATLEVAAKYSVSTAWVRRLKQRRRQTGEVQPRQGRPGPKPVLADHLDRLQKAARAEPDLSAEEYRDRLGVACAVVTVWRALRGLGLTFKKVIHAEEQRRPDVAARREQWLKEVLPGLEPQRLVFLDETAAKTNMTRTYGYAPKGERLEGEAPYRRWQTTTFVGAMRASGFIAPMVIDGAVTSELFLAYVDQVLVKELKKGDVVVLDNLNCHTQKAVRESLEKAGCRVLYQPPYSPDLNPIELAFSKLKRLLRKAAARTVEGLWATIGRLLDQFSPEECANYFRHRGYAATPS